MLIGFPSWALVLVIAVNSTLPTAINRAAANIDTVEFFMAIYRSHQSRYLITTYVELRLVIGMVREDP